MSRLGSVMILGENRISMTHSQVSWFELRESLLWIRGRIDFLINRNRRKTAHIPVSRYGGNFAVVWSGIRTWICRTRFDSRVIRLRSFLWNSKPNLTLCKRIAVSSAGNGTKTPRLLPVKNNRDSPKNPHCARFPQPPKKTVYLIVYKSSLQPKTTTLIKRGIDCADVLFVLFSVSMTTRSFFSLLTTYCY